MSRSYLSVHWSPAKTVLRILWMISALSSVTLFPFLWTLKFKRKRLICRQKIGQNESYSKTSKNQLYTITEFFWEEYFLMVIWDQRKRSQKAERFAALFPLNSFIISESCLKASVVMFSNSFSLFVDVWVKTKRWTNKLSVLMSSYLLFHFLSLPAVYGLLWRCAARSSLNLFPSPSMLYWKKKTHPYVLALMGVRIKKIKVLRTTSKFSINCISTKAVSFDVPLPISSAISCESFFVFCL